MTTGEQDPCSNCGATDYNLRGGITSPSEGIDEWGCDKCLPSVRLSGEQNTVGYLMKQQNLEWGFNISHVEGETYNIELCHVEKGSDYNVENFKKRFKLAKGVELEEELLKFKDLDIRLEIRESMDMRFMPFHIGVLDNI